MLPHLIERRCETCGVTFLVARWQLRHGACRFCSRACYGLTQRGTTRRSADRAEMVRLYCEERLSCREIGARFGLTLGGVSHHLRGAGVTIRPPDGSHLAEAGNRAKRFAATPRGVAHGNYRAVPLDGLVAAYVSGLSAERVGARFGVSDSLVLARLRAAGVVRRRRGFTEWQTAPDGHRVQSGLELQVDDWLRLHGVAHETQPRVPFHPSWRADFLARGHYIEVWGMRLKGRYAARRLAKLAHYRAHGLALIGVEPRDFVDGHLTPLQQLL